MRLEILDHLHSGHQGINKCQARARQAVWWPEMSTQLTELVIVMSVKNRAHRELNPSYRLNYWGCHGKRLQWIWKKQTYLLIVDYYSRFIEVARLEKLSYLPLQVDLCKTWGTRTSDLKQWSSVFS